LVAIPGERLDQACRRISAILAANTEMKKFYADRKSQYAQPGDERRA
jgi:hypothetical protein